MADRFQEIALPDGYEVYCFDYYDTVAYRTVEPEYVKKLWCKEARDYFGLSLSIGEFYRHRQKTEAELCKSQERRGFDLEFQYRQLAERMYLTLVDGLGISKGQFLEKAEEIELEIECRVQRKCQDVIEEIARLKSSGKKIICISDFYASVDFMGKLFAYHGIDRLFDEVYVSSEYLLTKRSGRLYDYILQAGGLPADKYIMVGDNPWSDYESPRKKGMAAYILDRGGQREKYKRFLAEHEKSNYVSRRLMGLYHACNRQEYEDLTFSLYCFTDKLYAALRRQNVKDVFFLSREGEFLKKIFDTYQERREVNGRRMNSHYLMVSRKSTFMASLKQVGEEGFEMVFRQYRNISLYDFLSSLGFSLEVQEEIGRRLQADIYEKQTDLPNSRIYQEMLCDDCFLRHYEKLRVEQKQNFAAYLDSFHVDFHSDGLCIVDVGWKGTIQDNIFRFFEEKVEILGLYIGLVNPGKVHPKNQKKGLLFTNIPKPSKCFYVYDENKSIFEVMLGASHGSADHYERKKQGIAVATAEKKEERDLFRTVISPMQEGIYQCFVRIDEALMDHCFEEKELEAVACGIHARLVFLPLGAQMDLFYKIYHYENFGVFEFTKFRRQEHVSWAKRCKNIAAIWKQRRIFFQSGYWGVIALKNAGLGIFIRPYGWYMYRKYYWKG